MKYEEKINKAILTLDVLIDCTKEDGTSYTARKEWEALATFKQLQNNWNELKNFIEERIKFIQEEKAEFEEDLYNDYETNNAEITIRRCNLTQLEDVQDKMQELEGKNE